MFWDVLRNIKKNKRGATIVEFAFAAPVILLLTFGFFEYCMVLFTQGVLHYSAQEATRYALVNFDSGNLDPAYLSAIKQDIKDKAKESLTLIDDSKISAIDVSVIANAADQTKTVGVNISYSYHLALPLLPQSNFTLRGSSESFLIQ